ncbi:MAG: matrixin family metalloprotease [Bdellovibrionota bacterium]
MKKQSRTLVDTASKGLMVWMMASSHAFAFSLISHDGVPARWAEGKSVEIEIDTDFTPYIDREGCDMEGVCQSIYSTVKKSIDAWKNVSNTKINISNITTKSISETPHYDGKNQIKMYDQGWSDLPFNPPASALAVTISTYTNPNTIVDSDIFFNAQNFQWAVINSDLEYNQYDIENVLTHEIGHFLGLDHTSEDSSEHEAPYVDATMFFASRPGEVFRRTLEQQDILGIQHLYDATGMPAPIVDEISPNNLQINSQTETIEIFGSDFYPTIRDCA